MCVFILLGSLTFNFAWQLRCMGCTTQARILNETGPANWTWHLGVAKDRPLDPFLFPHLYHATTAELETPPSSASGSAGPSGEAVFVPPPAMLPFRNLMTYRASDVYTSPSMVPPRARDHFPIGSYGDGVPDGSGPWMTYRVRTPRLPT